MLFKRNIAGALAVSKKSPELVQLQEQLDASAAVQDRKSVV